MSIFKKRKTKYGISSAVLTAAVVLAVIVFNTVFKMIADAGLWYFDMTEEKLFTLSDETKQMLSSVDAPVEIYFTQSEDKLMSGENTSPYMKYVYNTALQIEKEFPNIKVSCVDVIENPAFFEYYYNTAASTIKTTNVIIRSGSEFRLMALDAFFMWNEEYTAIWGYDGEARMTAAILQVTTDEMPVVYFTTGHGEPGREGSEALWQLFESAGFEVRSIDLSREEIDDSGRILVINNPITDFTGIADGGAENEIAKIDAFVDDLGCLMVFADSEKSKKFTNLSEYLYEWGVEFKSGQSIVDTFDSVTSDGKSIVAQYDTENTLGASLYTDIKNLESTPKVVFPNTMPLGLVYEETTGAGYTRVASPVFYSGENSVVYEDGEAVEEGSKVIATLSREQIVKEANDYFYSYVFVCGSADFVSDKYINSSSFVNSDIILNTARLIGREKIVADIDPKVFDNTELVITAEEANNLSIAMIVVLPVIVAAAGTFVYIRRRHS